MKSSDGFVALGFFILIFGVLLSAGVTYYVTYLPMVEHYVELGYNDVQARVIITNLDRRPLEMTFGICFIAYLFTALGLAYLWVKAKYC